MTRLIAAEFRKLFTTRLWLWLTLVAAAWTAGYSALAIMLDNRSGELVPPLSGAAGQHALFAIGAGGAGPLVAALAAVGVAGEFRHRTAAATFLATPRRSRVVGAKLVTSLLAGAGYGLACVVLNLAVAVPWLSARGIQASPAGHGDLAVLAAVVVSVSIFGAAGTGLAALLGSELLTVAGLVSYLYVAEPLISHVAALHDWTAYLPGVAADGLTQAAQSGVRLLSPALGGLVFVGWAAAFAAAGAFRIARRDVTG